MIKEIIFKARVKTEIKYPSTRLASWTSERAVEQQAGIRHAGEGIITAFVPGSGSDILNVLHDDGRVGLYFYDELTYLDEQSPEVIRQMINSSAARITQRREELAKLEVAHEELVKKLSKTVLD